MAFTTVLAVVGMALVAVEVEYGAGRHGESVLFWCLNASFFLLPRITPGPRLCLCTAHNDFQCTSMMI